MNEKKLVTIIPYELYKCLVKYQMDQQEKEQRYIPMKQIVIRALEKAYCS